jgi:aerobic carbon-monoxide dehydrogenase medium subunit
VLALNATVQTTQRSIAADDFFLGLYATALEPGELVKSVSFPIPDASGYAKFKQPASRYAVVGVFVAKFASGVRVVITGAGNGVFRHAGLEAALTKDFSPKAVESVAIDASELNGDIHASADYRAALITVQTQRAVEQALA